MSVSSRRRSSRHISLTGALLTPPARPSRLALPATAAAIAASAARQRRFTALQTPSPLIRQVSGLQLDWDLRFEVFFHLPGRTELQRLAVHRSQSLVAMQAAVQREFGVPFEQQRLYFQGEQLEGDDELCDYGLKDQSVLVVRVAPRFRRIGDVFSTVRTVRFPSPTSRPEDFQLVEIAAGLPPLRVVFQRIAYAIAYLTTLDRMQAQRTHRRVWRQHVAFWDEPPAPPPFSTPPSGHQFSDWSPRHRRSPMQQQLLRPAEEELSSSFVLQVYSAERVASTLALAHAHGVQQRLQKPPASRTGEDLRHLTRWLGNLKYFADARLPATVFQELARTSSYVRVRSGDFVFRQGDVGDCFYVLITGCVSLAAYGTGFFCTLTPGTCFGEISLIEAQGVRTASASVTFATPSAELAVVSGDLYRHAIKPYKQVVLRATEKAILSIPQLHALPSHAITHLAYAAKPLTAQAGKHIVCRGDEISVLVLLVRGAVKVSKPPLHGHPVVTVVNAPAVFGQEGALATTVLPAPWELVALDTCTLLCVRKDTIVSFLSPFQGVIRALMSEHHERIRDFHRRFSIGKVFGDSHRIGRQSMDRGEQSTPRSMSLHLAKAPPGFLEASVTSAKTRNKSIVFPHILLRDEDTAVECKPGALRWEEPFRPVTTTATGRSVDSRGKPPRVSESTLRSRPNTHAGTRTSPSCTELEAQFLSHTLPFSRILGLQDQLRYVPFEQPSQQASRHLRLHQDTGESANDKQSEARTVALLDGLRRIPVEDVRLLPVSSPVCDVRSPRYRFVAVPSPHSPRAHEIMNNVS
ncbi:hypothetical protein BBJ28_00005309 [Nothophytophthora sp. Chile5]|nr:hypothetical protein BBJ28_00005309 [Nothophytophthora sp. Chile5]